MARGRALGLLERKEGAEGAGACDAASSLQVMHRELHRSLAYTGPVRPTATCPMAKLIHATNDKPWLTRAPVLPGYVTLSGLEITDCSH